MPASIDALSVAVTALVYFVSDNRALPVEMDMRWFVERHPCDGQPYLAGIAFNGKCEHR